jgi:hypothetical protein
MSETNAKFVADALLDAHERLREAEEAVAKFVADARQSFPTARQWLMAHKWAQAARKEVEAAEKLYEAFSAAQEDQA